MGELGDTQFGILIVLRLKIQQKTWASGHYVGEVGRSISPSIETKEEAGWINELAVN